MSKLVDAINKLESVWPYSNSLVMYYVSGANGYGFYSNDADYQKGNSVTSFTVEKFNQCVEEMSKAEWIKPVTPIYTQIMSVNGVMPIVGMECLIRDDAYNDEYYKGVISFVGISNTVWVHGGTEYSQSNTHLKFKPLTPPIELIDGKAYQFDYHNGSSGMNNVAMRYNEFIGKFQFDNHTFNPIHCTNIQLLEVKS